MIVDGVDVTIIKVPKVSKEEVENYIQLILEEDGRKPSRLTISMDENGKIVLDYEVKAVPFERIRRITGYLVGDMSRWNNAKKAEEHDRVKHKT